MGFILLEGGAEFGGQMAAADRQAIRMAGGPDVPIRIIPAAAAPDNNHRRAGQTGINWFQSLGATDVSALALINRQSADDPGIAAQLARARLIYLLGGFPHFLGRTLRETRSWQAIQKAHAAGAVIAGSSAGAMVLCEYYYDPATSRVHPGLNLISGVCVVPHHETFGQNWVPALKKMLKNAILVGIDEQTGAINDAASGRWRGYGQGKITLYRNDTVRQFSVGHKFSLSIEV